MFNVDEIIFNKSVIVAIIYIVIRNVETQYFTVIKVLNTAYDVKYNQLFAHFLLISTPYFTSCVVCKVYIVYTHLLQVVAIPSCGYFIQVCACLLNCSLLSRR